MPSLINIQYLYNSGFTIEYNDHFIVIDYCEGDLELPDDKQVVFIVTHAHSDHYNPAIFTWPGSENATYLVSNDVGETGMTDNIIHLSDSVEETEALKVLYDPARTLRVGPDEFHVWDGLHIQTFGSTDAGISILFELDQVMFFHAGDLNAWKWPNTSDQEQAEEEENFIRILEKVQEYPIDIGFGVVDPRLEENTFRGAELFLAHLHPQLFIPMHFREDTEITTLLQTKMAHQTDVRIARILGRGQRIEIQG